LNETGHQREQQGFRESEQLNIKILQDQLDTRYFGQADHLIYVPSIASTNTTTMQLARTGSEEGVVVLTNHQTAGKGRLGRRWVDTSGCNAIASILLRPLFPPYLLVMIASLAVVETIAEISGVIATIKWPNDVLIGDRKVAGILIETSHDHAGQMVAVMGIGLNVNAHNGAETELASIATNLETACGHPVQREACIAMLLRHLEISYRALQDEVLVALAAPATSRPTVEPASLLIREKWRNHLSTLRHRVQVRQGDTIISGIAEDVNESGELLLRIHSGQQVSITWGDVGYPTE
jgi:BirA family biotin operon repressor/biotin-[acetyl-CoA-carboxylase] ligase